MNDTTNWRVPKWPFLLGDGLLMVFGFLFVNHSPPPGHWAILAIGCAVLGAALGVVPFILDYRAMSRALEINALGAIAEKIQNLEKVATQISSATNHWASAEESIRGQAEKTTLAAKAIADRMTTEVIEFSDLMKKMNDSEKVALKLEVDKLRRGETEWLQVLVTLLDHVFALHAGAVRTGDAKYSGPVTNFQSACYDVVRRLGLVPFVGVAGEPFDADSHKTLDGKEAPSGAVISETIGCGYTFQGQPLRPALVRLREGAPPSSPPAPKPAAAPAPSPEKGAVEKPGQKPAEKPSASVSGKVDDEFSLESPD